MIPVPYQIYWIYQMDVQMDIQISSSTGAFGRFGSCSASRSALSEASWIRSARPAPTARSWNRKGWVAASPDRWPAQSTACHDAMMPWYHAWCHAQCLQTSSNILKKMEQISELWSSLKHSEALWSEKLKQSETEWTLHFDHFSGEAEQVKVSVLWDREADKAQGGFRSSTHHADHVIEPIPTIRMMWPMFTRCSHDVHFPVYWGCQCVLILEGIGCRRGSCVSLCIGCDGVHNYHVSLA